MIAGFIVQGSSPKRVLIRAAGPSLTQFGVPNALVNPRLELHDSNNTIGMNDDWQTTQIGGVITSDQVAEIQNSGLAPSDPAESAVIATLPPGSYTAIVQGVNGGTGVGIVEVYDLNSASASLLVNISTRGFVQAGDNAMIGGFIVVTQATRVIIRAIGPSLTQFGVPDALANPQLELHDATSLIGQNNDWQTTQLGGIITSDQVAEIQNSQLAPTNSAESAIIATLQPGSYTAIVRGVNNTTGNGLVEVYQLSGTATPTPTPTPTCDSREPRCFDVGVFMTDSPDPVEVGRNLTYSITVSGNGVGVGWPVHMTDTLPAGVNFVSVSTSEGTCTGSSTISCDLFLSSTGAAVFPGILTARVTLVVAPTATGTLSNTAVIVPAPGDINPSDDSYTETTTVIPATSPTPTPAAQALNLSTRMRVQTGNNVGIGGFIITGSAPKVVLLRGIGPSLSQFGVPDALANPQLELHDATSLIAQNDNWQTTQIFGIITSDQVAEIQTSQLAPINSAESAIIATLQPGSYTAIVRGVNNTTGNALVEVYALQ
jgi:uncharacterized repeat protein (TIGR01451 family)